jgi:hypothetical protein
LPFARKSPALNYASHFEVDECAPNALLLHPEDSHVGLCIPHFCAAQPRAYPLSASYCAQSTASKLRMTGHLDEVRAHYNAPVSWHLQQQLLFVCRSSE